MMEDSWEFNIDILGKCMDGDVETTWILRWGLNYHAWRTSAYMCIPPSDDDAKSLLCAKQDLTTITTQIVFCRQLSKSRLCDGIPLVWGNNIHNHGCRPTLRYHANDWFWIYKVMHLINDAGASLKSTIKSMNQCFFTNSFSSSSQIQLCTAVHVVSLMQTFPPLKITYCPREYSPLKVQISNLLSILILCSSQQWRRANAHCEFWGSYEGYLNVQLHPYHHDDSDDDDKEDWGTDIVMWWGHN